MKDFDLDPILWTIVGIIGICAVYAVAFLIERNAEDTRRHDQQIKTTKIEACKTIPDPSQRALCIVLGGAGHE